MTRDEGRIGHDGFGRFAEKVGKVQVDRCDTLIFIFKDQLLIAGGMTDEVHGGTLAQGDLLHQGDIAVGQDEAHALLRFVAHDLACRKGGIAHRQTVDVNGSPCGLHKFRKSIEVTAGAVVVDGDDGIVFHLRHRPDGVENAFLHLGVRPLYGIQLNGVGIFAGGNRGDRPAAHPDPVVVAPQYHDVLSGHGLFLETVLCAGKADAAGLHDHLVVSENLSI